MTSEDLERPGMERSRNKNADSAEGHRNRYFKVSVIIKTLVLSIFDLSITKR